MDMDMDKMGIIRELMEELIEEMQYDEKDFSSRLGRDEGDKEMEMIEMEAPKESPDSMEIYDEEMSGHAPEGHMKGAVDSEEKLRKRILKLRQ